MPVGVLASGYRGRSDSIGPNWPSARSNLLRKEHVASAHHGESWSCRQRQRVDGDSTLFYGDLLLKSIVDAVMEAQRELVREESDGDYPTTATGESLPPPPAAFPISEFSRISAQLLEATPAPRVTNTDSSSPSELGRNPFGDSNAVSRNSIASTTSESQRDPFSHEVDNQSFRDDASFLAPPPEYEEFVGGSGAVGRRVSDGAPLPSYTAVEGATPEKQQSGTGAPRNDVVSSISTTESLYPQEKPNSSDEKRAERSQETVQPSIPEMRERSRAELSAISDAISRVYASSPSLDNQRATPSSSRPTSRSGLAEDDPERTGLGGKLSSLLLGKSMDGKGKRRESKARAEEEESVVIEGRRMSRTMADDLLQIWDNIDRAHGRRE